MTLDDLTDAQGEWLTLQELRGDIRSYHKVGEAGGEEGTRELLLFLAKSTEEKRMWTWEAVWDGNGAIPQFFFRDLT